MNRQLNYIFLKYRKEILIFTIIILSLMGILGWVFKIPLLIGDFHNYLPTAPLSLISFIFVSISIYFIFVTHNKYLIIIGKAIIGFILFVIIIVLIESIFSLKLDIESIFGNISEPFRSYRKGRISEITAGLILLIILYLIVNQTSFIKLKLIFNIVPIIIFAYSFLLITGYIYNTPFYYTGKVIPISLPSSIIIFLISISLLDIFRVNFIPRELRKQSKIASRLASAFIPVTLIIVISHGIIAANITYTSANPAVTFFSLLLFSIILTIIVIYYMSKNIGISIETVEIEKLNILREKQWELKRQNEEYIALNEEYKSTNEELFKAKEKAEEGERLKTAFLQNMSHEIRTPMNAILGFSSLLINNSSDTVKTKEYARVIHQRANDLLIIINEILEISRIETGQMQYNEEICNLNQNLHEIYLFFEKYKTQIGKDNLVLEYIKVPQEKNLILTDVVKFNQIFINLINNALKNTILGKINFGFESVDKDFIIFFVADTGKGIPKDKFDEIFKRFVQLDKSSEYIANSGLGLGLAIVKGILDFLGGTIWLKSKLDKGTTFYFSIPFKIF